MAWVPALIAAAPAPTSAGVLGIARTTLTGATASIAFVVTPAATERMRSQPASATVRATAGTSPGLTASTAPSAFVGSATTVTFGYLAVSSSRRAATTSSTANPSWPAARRPPSRASPMRPPPAIRSVIAAEAYAALR